MQNKCRRLPPFNFPVIFNKNLAYYAPLAGKVSPGYEKGYEQMFWEKTAKETYGYICWINVNDEGRIQTIASHGKVN